MTSLLGLSASSSEQMTATTDVAATESSESSTLYNDEEHSGVLSFTSDMVKVNEKLPVNVPEIK